MILVKDRRVGLLLALSTKLSPGKSNMYRVFGDTVLTDFDRQKTWLDERANGWCVDALNGPDHGDYYLIFESRTDELLYKMIFG